MSTWVVTIHCLSLWLILSVSPAARIALAAPDTLIVSTGARSYDPATVLSVLEDRQSEWGVSQVSDDSLASLFSTLNGEKPGFGFSRSAFWLRFCLANKADHRQDLLLELDYPLIDSIELYTRMADGSIRYELAGDHLPFAERSLDYRNVVFRLRLAPQTAQTYFMRVKSSSTLNIPLTLWAPEAFHDKRVAEQLVLGIFYGGFLIMLIYALFIFLAAREISYLYYALFIAGTLLVFLSLNGMAFQYLWPNATYWANICIPFILCFAVLWTILFTRAFLNTAGLSRRFDGILRLLAALVIGGMAGSLLLPYSIIIKISLALVIGTSFLLLGAGIHAVWSGFRPGVYFLIAWSAFLVGTLVYALMVIGVLPSNFFTNWSVQIGAALILILFSLGLADKITMLRTAKEQSEQAKELAEATAAAKSEFLATMSHEIRTPLNGVLGTTGLLRDTVLNQEQWEYVETIRLSGENLLTIINDILDFSKIESGKIDLEMQPFELRTCVEDVLDLFAAKATEKKLDLLSYVDDGVPPVIRSDRTRLQQILANLISNAIKFTQRGEVFVSAQTLSEGDEGLRLQFVVRDSGIGIAADKLDRLFEVFSQVDSSITRRYGGTGLGLAICKKLVNLLGGDIRADSREGRGTSFTFTIRVQKATAAESKTEQRQDFATLHDASVLIVDDNETNRLILSKQCQRWGMRTQTAQDADEALKVLRDGLTFDVGVLDYFMPGINGVELAMEWRNLPNGSPPLVLLSSGGPPGKLDERIDGLFITALAKPLRQSKLRSILAAALSGDTVRKETPQRSASSFDSSLGQQLPLHILVAEDNPINQKIALRVLAKLGYQADQAANGLEAVEAVERRQYDLVFMDMQMPEMDGLEATRTIINNTAPERRPQIIAMTANAMADDRDRCLAAGMNGFLSKPIQLDELTSKLEEIGTRIKEAKQT